MAARRAQEIPRQAARLRRPFYSRSVLLLAESLLGRMFLHGSDEGLCGGRIVEVEAYGGSDDPGSHAFGRMTRRNSVMFGSPGHLYVYFTYGMHHCANVVGEAEGIPGAVLIRALEPLVGTELMAARRRTASPHLIASGPGRLSQAMSITTALNGVDLVKGPIWIERPRTLKGEIRTSPRVGLSRGTDQAWRFYEDGPWISGKKVT